MRGNFRITYAKKWSAPKPLQTVKDQRQYTTPKALCLNIKRYGNDRTKNISKERMNFTFPK